MLRHLKNDWKLVLQFCFKYKLEKINFNVVVLIIINS